MKEYYHKINKKYLKKVKNKKEKKEEIAVEIIQKKKKKKRKYGRNCYGNLSKEEKEHMVETGIKNQFLHSIGD